MSLECPPDASIVSSGAARMRLPTKGGKTSEKSTVQAKFAGTESTSNSEATPHKPTQSSGHTATKTNDAELELFNKLGLPLVVMFPIKFIPKTCTKTHMLQMQQTAEATGHWHHGRLGDYSLRASGY